MASLLVSTTAPGITTPQCAGCTTPLATVPPIGVAETSDSSAFESAHRKAHVAFRDASIGALIGCLLICLAIAGVVWICDRRRALEKRRARGVRGDYDDESADREESPLVGGDWSRPCSHDDREESPLIIAHEPRAVAFNPSYAAPPGPPQPASQRVEQPEAAFNGSAAPAKADPSRETTATIGYNTYVLDRYLPEFLEGRRVLVPLGYRGAYLVDNSQARQDTHGLHYRSSPNIADRDFDELRFAPWGRSVTGELWNGWLRIQVVVDNERTSGLPTATVPEIRWTRVPPVEVAPQARHSRNDSSTPRF